MGAGRAGRKLDGQRKWEPTDGSQFGEFRSRFGDQSLDTGEPKVEREDGNFVSGWKLI